MTRELVFVHGRAQENVDSVGLKKTWIEAWRQGLARSGLDLPIPEDHIHFPYDGDTLAQIVAGRQGSGAREAAENQDTGVAVEHRRQAGQGGRGHAAIVSGPMV